MILFAHNITKALYFATGILMAAGALVGIVGTLIYPVLRNKFGLAKTGIFSYIFDIICLVPCIVSIFVAGSPFQPGFLVDVGHTDMVDFTTGYTKYDDVTFPTMSNTTVVDDVSSSYLSVTVLMAGIVASRAGT